jgi:hypothetical protein
MKILELTGGEIIREKYIDASQGYICGDNDIKAEDTIFHAEGKLNLSQLYAYGVKEFGRCISKVYLDDENGKPYQIGWVFQKRVTYSDSRETYLSEVWLTIERKYPARYEGIRIA